MSGPLRRNKRSRPADAGEPLQEGLAAEPESAAPTADTPPQANDAKCGFACHTIVKNRDYVFTDYGKR